MFSGFISPRLSPAFAGKEFNSVYVKKTKESAESSKYVNLNEPVISRGKKLMGKDVQGFFFTSMDSSSGDDDDRHRTNYKPSRRNGLQKSHSVESVPSSEEVSGSPMPESNFPVCDTYSPAVNRRRFTKIAERTMKSVMSTLSPNKSKKTFAVSTSSQEPVWPNSINTFARGVTTSKEQPTMATPDEPSLASLRIQLDVEEKDLLRQAAAKTVIFSGDLLRFDTPPSSPPGKGGVLMASYSDSDLYYPPCQQCMAFLDQKQEAEHYQKEESTWTTTDGEAIPVSAMHIEGNALVLAEGPPEDDFFA